jgi:hypothetical protein
MLRRSLLTLRTAHPPIPTLPRPLSHLRIQPPSRWPSPPTPRSFTTSTPRLARNYNYNRFNSNHRPSLFHNLLTRSKPHHFVLIGLGLSGVYLYNTEVVEMTGRRRFNCISHSMELKMGAESYREVLAQSQGRVLPDNHPLAQMVNRVLQRLIPQAPIEGADWRVHVIVDDGNANAFVLPG